MTVAKTLNNYEISRKIAKKMLGNCSSSRNKIREQSEVSEIIICLNGIKKSAEDEQVCTGQSPWVIASIVIRTERCPY